MIFVNILSKICQIQWKAIFLSWDFFVGFVPMRLLYCMTGWSYIIKICMLNLNKFSLILQFLCVCDIHFGACEIFINVPSLLCWSVITGKISLLLITVLLHRHSNSGPPFFLIWSLPWLWYGYFSGSISLNHLSIFYNISCYNSLVLITFVSRFSCRITCVYISKTSY